MAVSAKQMMTTISFMSDAFNVFSLLLLVFLCGCASPASHEMRDGVIREIAQTQANHFNELAPLRGGGMAICHSDLRRIKACIRKSVTSGEFQGVAAVFCVSGPWKDSCWYPTAAEEFVRVASSERPILLRAEMAQIMVDGLVAIARDRKLWRETRCRAALLLKFDRPEITIEVLKDNYASITLSEESRDDSNESPMRCGAELTGLGWRTPAEIDCVTTARRLLSSFDVATSYPDSVIVRASNRINQHLRSLLLAGDQKTLAELSNNDEYTLLVLKFCQDEIASQK